MMKTCSDPDEVSCGRFVSKLWGKLQAYTLIWGGGVSKSVKFGTKSTHIEVNFKICEYRVLICSLFRS